MANMKKKIFLIAGEPSGDFIGSKLMHALKETDLCFDFQGVGGSQMVQEGLKEVLPFEDFSVMGIFENIGKTYRLYKHLTFLKNRIIEEKPDLLITIDFPGFNFKLGKKLKGSGIPHLHYVGPTVWAWRPWRAKNIARFLKHLCVLFPFEPPYFEKYGLSTSFVGHPLMEESMGQGSAQAFRKKYAIEKDREVLLILPGSRRGELDHHLSIFQEATRLLKDKGKKIHIVIPTLDFLIPLIPTEGWGGPLTLVTDKTDKQNAYAASRLALAASGTISLELALARVPMLIAYKANPLSIWLVKRLIQIPYICMVNILLKRQVVPEFIQQHCRADTLSKALLDLMTNDSLREKQLRAFDRVEAMLSPQGKTPSGAGADVVVSLVR
jgi:lipid-A-disaccharide synthase